MSVRYRSSMARSSKRLQGEPHEGQDEEDHQEDCDRPEEQPSRDPEVEVDQGRAVVHALSLAPFAAEAKTAVRPKTREKRAVCIEAANRLGAD